MYYYYYYYRYYPIIVIIVVVTLSKSNIIDDLEAMMSIWLTEGRGCHCKHLTNMTYANRQCEEMTMNLTNSCQLTVRDPIASHVEPEGSVAPVQFFGNYFIHHRHVQIDGVVQKQRVDRTLYTWEL